MNAEPRASSFEDAALYGALDDLLRAAARRRPGAIFARVGEGSDDASAALRLGALDALADHYAGRFLDTGPPPRGRLLLLATPEPRTLAALVGALRAGLDVILGPPALNAAEIAEAAAISGANALAGPARFAQVPMGDRLFDAAARTRAVGLVALHGGEIGGALTLDAPVDSYPQGRRRTPSSGLFAVERIDGGLRCAPLSQSRLFEAARDYVGQTKLGEGVALASMVSLASPAGLLCGAYAPLLSGAHVVWQAPFSSRRFLDVLDSSAPAHLVAAAAAAADLGASGALTPDRLATLTLIALGAEPPPRFACGLDPLRVFNLRRAGVAGLRLEPLWADDPLTVGSS